MVEAFQHVGIGVKDIERSYDFYRRILGFSVKLNDHEEDMVQMESIIGEICRMRVIMAMNLSGGGAVELVQHTSSPPRPLPEDARWGDIGFLATGVKAFDIENLVDVLERKGVEPLTGITEILVEGEGTWKSAFVSDPDGIPVELLETPETRRTGGKPRPGGFTHTTVGVSDMDKALVFYNDILGYDRRVYDSEQTPEGLEPVTGGARCRTVVLGRSRPPGCKLPLEGGMVKLVQALEFKGKPLYEGRRWGDVGIMETAFDVLDVGKCYLQMVEDGAEPFCEPTRIDMGWGSVGTFAYVKDPDGNTIEMVEVEKLGFLPPSAISPVFKAVLKVRSKL